MIVAQGSLLCMIKQALAQDGASAGAVRLVSMETTHRQKGFREPWSSRKHDFSAAFWLFPCVLQCLAQLGPHERQAKQGSKDAPIE